MGQGKRDKREIIGAGMGAQSSSALPFSLTVLDIGWPVVHGCWVGPVPVPGPAELSSSPLSPNACWCLGHWCRVSRWIGFSWQPTDAALLQGRQDGQEEAKAPSSCWAPQGLWWLLSVVLGCGGPQVRAPWTPAAPRGQAVGSAMSW